MSLLNRVRHVLVAGTVLAAGTIFALSLAPEPVALATSHGPSTVTDIANAQRDARTSGKPVEVLAARTESSTVRANPNGSFTMEIAAGPERVRRADGAWTAISPQLRLRDGWYAPEATVADVRFSTGGTGPFAVMRQGTEEFTLTWPGTLPAPTLRGDTVVYPSVLPGVDLEATATRTGFSHVLVVHTPSAAANPAVRSIRLGVGGTSTVAPKAGGGLAVTGRDGKVLANAGSASMWDRGARTAAVGARPAGRDLVLTPDPALLDNPAAKYPIVIDPSFDRPGYVRWAFANNRNENNDTSSARVGLSPDSGAIYRSFFEFSPNSSKMTLRGTKILGAKLRTRMDHTWSCGSTAVSLFRTAGITSTPRSTWSPALQLLLHRPTVPSAHEGGGDCELPDRDVEFAGSLASDLQTFANAATWSSYTVALSAASNTGGAGEGEQALWKRFFPEHTKLVVDFNSKPKAPTNLTAEGKPCATGTGRPVVATATPALRAVVDDPDTETDLRAKFTWERWTGTAWAALGSATVTNHRNKDTALYRVATGMVGGGTYRYRVQTGDPWAYGSASGIEWSTDVGNCEFTIDTTPPQHVPQVSSTVYKEYLPDVEDGYHGSIGRTENFTFDAGGDPDVVGYRYGWQDPPTTTVSAPSPGAAVTLQLTPPPPYVEEPTSAGQLTLYVSSVDRAGLSSAPRVYQFRVASGSAANAWWKLAEPSGATQLADSSGSATPKPLTPTAVTGGAAGLVIGGPTASAFNGTTSVATASGGVVDTQRSFTVQAWVRLTTLSGSPTVAAQHGTSTSAFELGYRAGIGWSFQMHSGDVASPAVARASYLYVGQSRWGLLTGVYDAGARTLSLYVNGTLVSTAAHLSVWNGQSSVSVGKSFPGDLADVRLWDRAVPAAEISRFAGTQLARWTLDGDGTDLSEHGHTATPNGTVEWGTAKHDLGIQLAGTGYLTTAGPVLRTEQSYTVSAWVNPTALGDYPTILCQRGNQRCAFYLQYQPPSGRWAIVQPATDSASPPAYYSARSTTVPTVNTWVHLTGVFDASRGVLQLYVNGRLEGTTAAIPAMWHATGAVHIGRGDTGVWVRGSIDEVRVFAGALPAAEVARLYQP